MIIAVLTLPPSLGQRSDRDDVGAGLRDVAQRVIAGDATDAWRPQLDRLFRDLGGDDCAARLDDFLPDAATAFASMFARLRFLSDLLAYRPRRPWPYRPPGPVRPDAVRLASVLMCLLPASDYGQRPYTGLLSALIRGAGRCAFWEGSGLQLALLSRILSRFPDEALAWSPAPLTALYRTFVAARVRDQRHIDDPLLAIWTELVRRSPLVVVDDVVRDALALGVIGGEWSRVFHAPLRRLVHHPSDLVDVCAGVALHGDRLAVLVGFLYYDDRLGDLCAFLYWVTTQGGRAPRPSTPWFAALRDTFAALGFLCPSSGAAPVAIVRHRVQRCLRADCARDGGGLRPALPTDVDGVDVDQLERIYHELID